MSNLLKEAIIDAAALKEAALKQAENAVLEKYSRDVRLQLENILGEVSEDDELPADDSEMPPTDDAFMDFDLEDDLDMSSDSSYVDDQIPYGFAGGEDLCPCPDDDEEIEINFDELSKEMDSSEASPSDMMDREEIATDLDDLDDEDEDGLFEYIEISEDMIKEVLMDGLEEELEADMEGDFSSPTPSQTHSSELDFETDKQSLRNKYPTKGDNFRNKKYQDDLESSADVALYELEKEALNEKIFSLDKALSNYKRELAFFKKKNKKLNEKLLEISDTLKTVNESKAKLFYQNKVLRNTSLNERQKFKIVDAISDTGTVGETKVLYETLIKTVSGLDKKSKKPAKNTLSEVVNNAQNFSPVIGGQKPQAQQDDRWTRMQELAGITKN